MKLTLTSLTLAAVLAVAGVATFPKNVSAAISSYAFNESFTEIESELERQIELLEGARGTEIPTPGFRADASPVELSLSNLRFQLDFLRDIADIGNTLEYRYYFRADIVELDFIDLEGNLVRDVYNFSDQDDDPFRSYYSISEGRTVYVPSDYFVDYIRDEYDMDARILLKNPQDVRFNLFSSDVIFQYKGNPVVRPESFTARFLGAGGSVYNETLEVADIEISERRGWTSLSLFQQRRYGFEALLDLILDTYPAESSRERFTSQHNYANSYESVIQSEEWFSSPTYHFEVSLSPVQLATLDSILSPSTSTARSDLALVSISGSVPERDLLARVTFAPETVDGEDLPALTVQYRYGEEIAESDADLDGAAHNVEAVEEFIAAVREKIADEYAVSQTEINDRLQVSVDLFDSREEANTYKDSLSDSSFAIGLFGNYSIVERIRLTVGNLEGYRLIGVSDQDETYRLEATQDTFISGDRRGEPNGRYTIRWEYSYDGYPMYSTSEGGLTVEALTSAVEDLLIDQAYYGSTLVSERELAEDLVGYLVDNRQYGGGGHDCHPTDVRTITNIASYYANVIGPQRADGFRSIFEVNYRDDSDPDTDPSCVDDPDRLQFQNLRDAGGV